MRTELVKNAKIKVNQHFMLNIPHITHQVKTICMQYTIHNLQSYTYLILGFAAKKVYVYTCPKNVYFVDKFV